MASVYVRAIHASETGIETVEGEDGYLSEPSDRSYAFMSLTDGTIMRLSFEDGKVFWRGKDGDRDTVLQFRRHALAESGEITEISSGLDVRLDDTVVGCRPRPTRELVSREDLGRIGWLLILV